MKRLFIAGLFSVVCFSGCYLPETVTGHYYIKSDAPFEITYTLPSGDVTETTNLVDVTFELNPDNCDGVFYHCISIKSDTIQDIKYFVEFIEEDDTTVELDIILNGEPPTERCLYYCTPWASSCGDILIN